MKNQARHWYSDLQGRRRMVTTQNSTHRSSNRSGLANLSHVLRPAPADSTYPLRVADFHMPSEVKLPRYPDLSVDTLLSVGCHDVKMSGRDDSLLIGVDE